MFITVIVLFCSEYFVHKQMLCSMLDVSSVMIW